MTGPKTNGAAEDTDTPVGGAPLHGFHGQAASPERFPAGLSVAVSREAGARGRTIALRVGRLLGWPVYSQEELESLCRDGPMRDLFLADLPPGLTDWADHHLDHLQRHDGVSQHPEFERLARLILALGAQGEVVFVGRGAGFLLPPATTLHVRVVAPLADRITAMSQWLRLTREEAADQVRQRDRRREEFLGTHLNRPGEATCCYDLLLNSSRLGEELTADLIAQAARGKWEARLRE
jgi:cytidylate kinase